MQAIAIPDRSALCVEIRSCDHYGDKFNATHHWSIGSLDSQIQIQSVTCSICGNYQNVSSRTLYDTLMESARHIVCEDPEHIHITHEIIIREAEGRRPIFDRYTIPEDSDMETDTIPDLVSDDDEDLGPIPPLPPSLFRAERYDWQDNFINDWSQEGLYDWNSQEEFYGNFLPRQ